MAKKRKQKNRRSKPAWLTLTAGGEPVNSVAARVVGHGVRKPKHVTLREQAAKETDPERREELRAQASAAKAAYNRRMTDKAAEEKARKALERARWRRENGS